MYKKINMSGIIGLGLQSLTGINGYLNTLLSLGSASGSKNLTLYTDRYELSILACQRVII